MAGDSAPVHRPLVLRAFVHTKDFGPLHGSQFATEVATGGFGGAWAGFVGGGLMGWFRTPQLRAIFGSAVKGAGWYGALGSAFVAGSWFTANQLRDTEDNFNAAGGGAVVGLLSGASTLSATKAFGYPLLGAATAVLLQNIADTLISNSLAREYENPTPKAKGKRREGFWAWPKGPAEIDMAEFEKK